MPRYVKAKRSATVHNVREQERKEAANVNIVAEPDRKRATIAKEAEKSSFGHRLRGCLSRRPLLFVSPWRGAASF